LPKKTQKFSKKPNIPSFCRCCLRFELFLLPPELIAPAEHCMMRMPAFGINTKALFGAFENSILEFVSDFDIRYSDLHLRLCGRNPPQKVLKTAASLLKICSFLLKKCAFLLKNTKKYAFSPYLSYLIAITKPFEHHFQPKIKHLSPKITRIFPQFSIF